MLSKPRTLVMIIFVLFVAIFQVPTSFASNTTLQIASIGVDAPIVNAPLSAELRTWDVSHLYHTVGHLEYTPWFGQNGNVVLGGHSVALNGSRDVFYYLDQVQVGEIITVNDNETIFTYQVTEVLVVDYTDLSILYNRGGETLTLFTCQIESDNGRGFYSRRLVIFANRIG